MQIDGQTGVSIALVIGVVGAMWRTGKLEGQITALLKQLTDLAADHETRLRVLEQEDRE